MSDRGLLLKGLDWLGDLGVTPKVVEATRAEILDDPAKPEARAETRSTPAGSQEPAGAAADDVSSGQVDNAPQRELLEIVVDPATASLTPGKPQAFTATFEY